MTLAQVWGLVPAGVAAVPVAVEVDVAQGLPSVGVVGLAQASVAESRWRARSAIVNSGSTWPNARITVGLSPADVPKTGTSLDLPIAIGVLLATGQAAAPPEPAAFLGELGLDGAVKPVAGALACAIAARRAGACCLYVSTGNAREVAAVPGVRPVAVRDLGHLVRVLQGADEPEAWSSAAAPQAPIDGAVDLSDVRGHAMARMALEVAAAGGHHCVMTGPPGIGKSMLAQRFTTLLPDLEEDLALDVTAIHALAGSLGTGHGLMRRPPFVAPHHSTSPAALLGSVRQGLLVPGALTLAHGGVLFLDEAPEFARPCLEGLRQPLEQGALVLMRVGTSVLAPARFQLLLAANPCPCGQGTGRGEHCRCTPMARRRYAERLSGPLLDRIDIRLTVSAPTDADLRAGAGEASAAVAERVARARARALARWRGTPWRLNAQVPGEHLRAAAPPDAAGQRLLRRAEDGGLHPRGSVRVQRLAWTLADLDGSNLPGAHHVAAALTLRGEDAA